MKRKYKNIFVNLSDKLLEFSFLLPSLIGCFLFIFIPSIASFILSFCSWDLLSQIKYVSFNNYIELVSSFEFWFVLKNTFLYAFFVTIFATFLPLLFAAIINSKIVGKDFFKTAYFLPFITPMIVIALVWQWFFDPNIGFVNLFFKSNLNWLFDINLAMPVLIFVSVWKLIGYNIILYLTGFASLNNQVYEAAKIDGASEINVFFKITVPLLTPTIFFVLLVTTISSFQVFDLIYLMTQGGPENSTNIIVYWLYKTAFEFFEIGKASSIAYVLFIFILILTIIQWKLRKKWVVNE